MFLPNFQARKSVVVHGTSPKVFKLLMEAIYMYGEKRMTWHEAFCQAKYDIRTDSEMLNCNR